MKNKCAFTILKIFGHTLTLSIVASALHFVYAFSGENLFIGLFNPVNESVWEHLKFMFFPFLIWWIVMYLIKNKKCTIPLNTWIVSAAFSLVVAPMTVALSFYSYTGAFGIHSLLIDILLVPLSYFIALCMASHFLEYSRPNKWVAMISVAVIAAILTIFILFTLNPPHLPVFYDAVTQTYGI
jgi:hypothetical protein